MTYGIRARAERRALTVGLALGGAVGLLLGGAYAAGGMARTVDQRVLDQHAAAQRTAALASAHPAPGPALATAKPLAVTRVSTIPAKPFSLPQAGARDLDCLADAVYYEARGEGAAGQAAVAQVVLNRVRHPEFPKTVCGVVFQGVASADCQFSFACDGAMDRPKDRAAWAQAERIAARALAGSVMSQVGAATHFHAAGAAPEWGPGLIRVAQVGLHVFYRFGHGGGRFDGVVRPSGPGSDNPHAVYASMLPGIGIGGGDDAAKPATAVASAPSPAAPSVSLASAAKAKPDADAAKPAAPVS